MKLGKKTNAKILAVLLALLLPALPFAAPLTARAAEIQAGTPAITVNTTVVGFAGEEWWVIGDATTGVYPQPDSVTLLHKGTGNDPETYGNTAWRTGADSSFADSTQYSGDSKYYANNPGGTPGWTEPSEYRGSTLQQKMESIAGEITTASSKEYDLITPRTLTAGDDTNYPIKGGNVAGQKLWALSDNEHQTIGSNTVRAYGSGWWLRSPASDGDALQVGGSGNIFNNQVYGNYAARPALNLNLTSVLFTSAASGTGEKSNATASSALVAASAITGTIKFTTEDDNVAPGFLASATARSGDTYTITYAGAATDAKNSVSAIVTRGGAMTYYGRLVNPASANGTTTVTLPTGFDPATDTLKVFAEELNGDNYTDFATTPITLDTAAPTLMAGDGDRTSDTAATVKFTSGEAGTYYYQLDGTVPANAAALVSAGTNATTLTAAEQTITPALTAGAHILYITAKDAAGNVSNLLTLNIPAYTAPGTAPAITTASLPGGTAGTAYNQTLAATGTTPISWSVSGGNLPDGLTLNTDGTITGTPTVAGTFNFTVGAANGVLPNATKALSIAIAPALSTDTAPTISGPDTIALTVGYPTHTQAYIIDGTPTPTVTIEADTAGATFDGGTNELIIPLGLSAGTYSTTIKAENAAGTATKTVSVNVSGSELIQTPAPITNTASNSDDSGGGADYIAPVNTTTWLDAVKAGQLADKAKANGQGYARTASNRGFGVRGSAWGRLAGLQYRHDATIGKAVQVRVYIESPELFRKDTLVSGYTSGPAVEKIKALFTKWFENKLRVIHFDQQADWEQPVKVAAKVDLTGMDTDNLYFCSYNAKTGAYRRIETPDYWMDANGYLHFATPFAGDIIISEGALVRK
ncbi:hypothetical protein FACS1894191_1150 [Clostridia bacterium]|nr:hypothetical protein FACS1894191_1150 [Clostridia bacterium]